MGIIVYSLLWVMQDFVAACYEDLFDSKPSVPRSEMRAIFGMSGSSSSRSSAWLRASNVKPWVFWNPKP